MMMKTFLSIHRVKSLKTNNFITIFLSDGRATRNFLFSGVSALEPPPLNYNYYTGINSCYETRIAFRETSAAVDMWPCGSWPSVFW